MPTGTHLLFAAIVLLGVVIKLGNITNEMAIDRNWLPLLVPSSMLPSSASVYDLTHLNAAMRRIDLAVKIASPLLFNSLISITHSRRMVVTLMAAVCALSAYAQLTLASRISNSSPALHGYKPIRTEGVKDRAFDPSEKQPMSIPQQLWSRAMRVVKIEWRALRQYFLIAVWVPSMAWALLHMTVLAYSSSLMTYLLEVGFSLDIVTLAQASGSCVEFASTLITPWLIHRQSSRRKVAESTKCQMHEEADNDESVASTDIDPVDSSVLEKVGLWGILWQFCNLVCPEQNFDADQELLAKSLPRFQSLRHYSTRPTLEENLLQPVDSHWPH